MKAYNIARRDYADNSYEVIHYENSIVCGRTRKKRSVYGLRMLKTPVISPFDGSIITTEIIADDLYAEHLEQAKKRSNSESIKRTRKNVEIIGRANKWDFFLTVTFSDDTLGLDEDSARSAFTRWLDTFRHRYPNAEYLFVIEQGKKGRWHAHALMSGCKLRLVDSGRKTKGKHPQTIYNLSDDEYDLGFSTVTRVRSSAAAGRYISKYIGKALGITASGKKRYWASRGLKREKDIRQTYLFDEDEKENLLAYLQEVADKVNRVYVDAIDSWVTYFSVWGSDSHSEAGCPT